METPFGTVDLGLKNNVKRVEPKEKKEIEDMEVEDYRRLMDGDDFRKNGTVDLEIE